MDGWMEGGRDSRAPQPAATPRSPRLRPAARGYAPQIRPAACGYAPRPYASEQPLHGSERQGGPHKAEQTSRSKEDAGLRRRAVAAAHARRGGADQEEAVHTGTRYATQRPGRGEPGRRGPPPCPCRAWAGCCSSAGCSRTTAGRARARSRASRPRGPARSPHIRPHASTLHARVVPPVSV